MATKAAALALLQQCAPSEWLARSGAGERLMSQIHIKCYEAGLSATPTSADDVTKLHAMWAATISQLSDCDKLCSLLHSDRCSQLLREHS